MGTVLLLLNAGLLVPVVVFAIEVVAALVPPRGSSAMVGTRRPSLAVLVPAHDEAHGIAETLDALRPAVGPGDRLLVVADNCRDDTAAIARAHGAEVVERFDPDRRGKGYALDFGLRHLASAPPEVVVIVDADCLVQPGALERLAREAVASGRPVQGCYLLHAPPSGGLNLKVAAFAFLVKNRVRPRGLHRLGLPCQLTGSGMALPWGIAGAGQLAGASLVEDMKLGLDLARAGHAPRFCESARIDSIFPETVEGVAAQRQRWEQGHLGLMAGALRSLPGALRAGNLATVALAFDLLVPPFTLLAFGVGLLAVVTAVATFAFALPPLALILAVLSLILVKSAVVLAWSAFGRDTLPVREVKRMPGFLVGKLTFYLRLAAGARAPGWVRSDRRRNGE